MYISLSLIASSPESKLDFNLARYATRVLANILSSLQEVYRYYQAHENVGRCVQRAGNKKSCARLELNKLILVIHFPICPVAELEYRALKKKERNKETKRSGSQKPGKKREFMILAWRIFCELGQLLTRSQKA